MDERYNQLFLAYQSAQEDYDRAVGRWNEVEYKLRQYEGGSGYAPEKKALEAQLSLASSALDIANAREAKAKAALDSYAASNGT